MRTKWEVLQERLDAAKEALHKVQSEMDWMERTACNLVCDTCGKLLITEEDFAAHFVIPDERYLNLGNCPTKKEK